MLYCDYRLLCRFVSGKSSTVKNLEKEKEQIMNQLKEWGVNVIIDTDFAQRKEHERILEEKTKMREERKRLYEERKKRKQ